MSLKTLFALPIAVICLVTLSLAGTIAVQASAGLERGAIAIQAVERMRILVLLQTDLWAERLATNALLGQSWPPPEAALQRLGAARHETDRTSLGLAARVRAQKRRGDEVFLKEMMERLAYARATVDGLVARDGAVRTYAEASAVMPRMLAASAVLEQPLARASLDVADADPGLSGLLAVSRLAALLRDGVSRVPAVLVPRFTTERTLTREDVEAVHVLLAQAAQLTGLLRSTIEIADPTERMRAALTALEEVDSGGVRVGLTDLMAERQTTAVDRTDVARVQRLIIPWSERINALRGAIVDAALQRVTAEQHARTHRLWLVGLASGSVALATLMCVALLRWRVVGPLARLGVAITRIAAGDRGTPLVLRSATREIAEMVKAVETLRQAALIADATETRQRIAARQRLATLREALGIVLTMEEPARSLEHGVACLSEGIESAIALVQGPLAGVPPALGTAANAVRLGLAELRGSAADLKATMAAARDARARDDGPEAEIVARIQAIRDHVERRDAAVRGFVQPSLVALRDASAAGGDVAALRDLVRDQFQRLETAVATVSSMRAQVARAATIVRDLPLVDEPLVDAPLVDAPLVDEPLAA